MGAHAQVNKQIDHMVTFIKQEAEEKASEIRMSAEEVRAAPRRRCRQRPGGVFRAPAGKRARRRHAARSQEFNLEKLNLLETEKQRIRKEYERKEAQVEAAKKMRGPSRVPYTFPRRAPLPPAIFAASLCARAHARVIALP